jgi:hypothetical protein
MSYKSLCAIIDALKEAGASDEVVVHWIDKYLDLRDPALYIKELAEANPLEWGLALWPKQLEWLWQRRLLDTIKRAYSLMVLDENRKWAAYDFAKNSVFSDDPTDFGLITDEGADGYSYEAQRVKAGRLASERELLLLQLGSDFVSRTYLLCNGEEGAEMADPGAIRELIAKAKALGEPVTKSEIAEAVSIHLSRLQSGRSFNPIRYKLDTETWESVFDRRIAEIEAILAE